MTLQDHRHQDAPATDVRTPELDELPADLAQLHQPTFEWATKSKQETMLVCSCGDWVGLRRRPEVLGSIQAALAEYEGHLVVARG